MPLMETLQYLVSNYSNCNYTNSRLISVVQLENMQSNCVVRRVVEVT